MQVLNKYDKEQLVIRLHKEGKTVRYIAAASHVSFGDIKKIIRCLSGEVNDTDLSNKSKDARAFELFLQGKQSVEVAIELDMPADKVEDLHIQ